MKILTNLMTNPKQMFKQGRHTNFIMFFAKDKNNKILFQKNLLNLQSKENNYHRQVIKLLDHYNT